MNKSERFVKVKQESGVNYRFGIIYLLNFSGYPP